MICLIKDFVNIIYQIDRRIFLQALGLIISILGTIILAIPLFKVWRILEEDDPVIEGKFIKDKQGNVKHSYTYPWLLKNRKFGFWGLGLLGSGFLIQLLLTIL